jgi:thioredoxin-like negative regulator of GroEL
MDNFESEVLREKKPVLLACFYWGADVINQIQVLESVSEKYGEGLKTCLIDVDSLAIFQEALGIEGTPTFLIFDGGREKSRMLGQADGETLTAFIRKSLSCFLDDQPLAQSQS